MTPPEVTVSFRATADPSEHKVSERRAHERHKSTETQSPRYGQRGCGRVPAGDVNAWVAAAVFGVSVRGTGPCGSPGGSWMCLSEAPRPAPDGAAWQDVPASNARRCRKETTCGTS